MITIQIGKKRFRKICTHPDELSDKQLIRWAELLHAKLTISQFNVLMLLCLLEDWQSKLFFFKNEYFIPFLDKITFGIFIFSVHVFDYEQLHELAQISGSFHDSSEFPYHNPVPKIRRGFFQKSLIAPLFLFNNLSFRQFRKTEEYLIRYLQEEKIEYLHLLISWLYLPEHSTDYDLSDDEALHRAKYISRLSDAKLQAIFNSFLRNRNAVISLYQALFPKKKIKTKIKTDYFSTKKGYESSLRFLSKNVLNVNQIDLEAVHAVLPHLNDLAEDQARIDLLTAS